MRAVGLPRRDVTSGWELGLRWSAGVALIALAIQTVWAARSLFADGAYYLWVVETTGAPFTYTSRVVTQVVTQLPVVISVHLGIADAAFLARAQSFGAGALPVLIWVAALTHLRRSRLFWVWVVAFATVFLNSGFMTVGEYNFAYAVVAISAAILLREGPISRSGLVVLVIVGTLHWFSYETLVFLAPLLAAFAIVRLRRERRSSVGWPTVALRVSIATSFVATLIAAYYVVFPRDPKNLASAADVLDSLRLNPQLIVSVVVAMVFTGVWAVLRGRTRVLGFGVLMVPAAWILLTPRVWSLGGQQYSARVVVGALFFTILLIAGVVQLWWARRQKAPVPGARSQLATAISACVIGASLAVPFAYGTAGFAVWLRDVQSASTHQGELVTLDDSGVPPASSAKYAWGWTDPYLSQLLHSGPGEVTILNPGDTLQKHPGLPPGVPRRFEVGQPLFP